MCLESVHSYVCLFCLFVFFKLAERKWITSRRQNCLLGQYKTDKITMNKLKIKTNNKNKNWNSFQVITNDQIGMRPCGPRLNNILYNSVLHVLCNTNSDGGKKTNWKVYVDVLKLCLTQVYFRLQSIFFSVIHRACHRCSFHEVPGPPHCNSNGSCYPMSTF